MYFFNIDDYALIFKIGQQRLLKIKAIPLTEIRNGRPATDKKIFMTTK